MATSVPCAPMATPTAPALSASGGRFRIRGRDAPTAFVPGQRGDCNDPRLFDCHSFRSMESVEATRRVTVVPRLSMVSSRGREDRGV
jgi:hypothetical protein